MIKLIPPYSLRADFGNMELFTRENLPQIGSYLVSTRGIKFKVSCVIYLPNGSINIILCMRSIYSSIEEFIDWYNEFYDSNREMTQIEKEKYGY